MKSNLALLISRFVCIFWMTHLSDLHAQDTNAFTIDALKKDLYDTNIQKAIQAAVALGTRVDEASVDVLITALQLGAHPRLLVAILEALELQKSPKSWNLIVKYTKYRGVQVRQAALKALMAFEDKRNVAIFLEALQDSDPLVRAQAGRYLGEIEERSAEIPLLNVLKRGDVSAVRPLVKIGRSETVRQMGSLLGSIPDSVVVSTLAGLLLRQDMGPDPLRNEIVGLLGNVPGALSTKALTDYVQSVPKNEARVSKKTAEKLLRNRAK